MGFLEARSESRTNKLGKDLETKMEKMMDILLALSTDVAFLKGAISNKK